LQAPEIAEVGEVVERAKVVEEVEQSNLSHNDTASVENQF
jgi:hypothetical protein